jgi:hypothetical protein
VAGRKVDDALLYWWLSIRGFWEGSSEGFSPVWFSKVEQADGDEDDVGIASFAKKFEIVKAMEFALALALTNVRFFR